MTNTACVMISGIASDAEAWAPQIAALGDIATCHVIPRDGDTIEAMAAHILAQAPPGFALAGHSLGGYVAMAVQRIAPARVRRLALLNTAAAPDDARQRAAREALVAMAETHGYDAVIERLLPAMTAAGSAFDAALTHRLRAMLRRTGEVAFVRDQRAAAERADARLSLAQIRVPTLVIVSDMDRIVPPDRGVDIARHIPGARLVMVAGAGHLAMLEQPALVNAALRDWLTGEAAPGDDARGTPAAAW